MAVRESGSSRPSPERDAPPRKDPAGARGTPEVVVGIGASAGGLAALEAFLDRLPPRTGAGYVIVQHLSPDERSLTAELLQKHTSMPVRQATNGMALQSDEVVIIPPTASLRIQEGVLLLRMGAERGPTRSLVDVFFRSLAEDYGRDAVGIVLSGTGSDGTLGLKAIQDEGGVTLVQDPSTAEFDGMPASAIRAGAADQVAPISELTSRLLDYLARRGPEEEPWPGDAGPPEELIARATSILRERTGHDFATYKRGTLVRRLRRRLDLCGTGDLERYLDEVQEDPAEADALFRDLMIGVTEFFRDPEAWNALAERAVPKLFANRGPEDEVRAWVSGCATGEEAYTLGILLLEHAAHLSVPPSVRIFATDIDEKGLAFARQGLYPDGVAERVSPERLERFFRREDGHYRVAKQLRELCTFAPHNLLQDPPFSRLDLISCRNLLIYLTSAGQERAMRVFQYGLEPGRYLFLGSSENLISGSGELFDTVDRKRRIFRRTDLVGGPPLGLLDSVPKTPRSDRPRQRVRKRVRQERLELRRKLESALLQGYGPAALLIDGRRDVHHFFGRTGRYFEPSAAGSGSNAIDMARPDLRAPLHGAIRKSEREGREVMKRLKVRTEAGTETVELWVRPASELGRDTPLLLVVLREVSAGESTEAESTEVAETDETAPVEARAVRELEAELRETRERLQATIEELESSNEELQSANEELLSMNEELQTSKEEAQSINEELKTVNYEVNQKVAELDRAHGDLQNLFRSTEIATIFVDMERRIQRVTPTVTDLFRLRESDVGRPLEDIAHRFTDGNLAEAIAQVLETSVPRQMEVETPENGAWYTLRISPYRTLDGEVEGAVLTFTDVTQLKRTEAQLREERYAKSIIETVREPLLVLDSEHRVVTASRAFYEIFRSSPEETRGAPFFRLAGGKLNIPELRERLERVLPEGETVEDLELEVEVPELGARTMRLDARHARSVGDETERILVTLQDITELRERERAREEESRRKDWILAMLGHELRNPLAPLRNCAHLMRQRRLDDAQQERLLQIIDRQVAHLTRLVDDMLDISRIAEGKLRLRTERMDLVELTRSAVEDRRKELEEDEKDLAIELDLPDHPLWIEGDDTRLAQAIGNLLDNARKYTDRGGSVTLRVGAHAVPAGGGSSRSTARVVVEDTGMGMTGELLDRVFEPFQQGPRGPDYEEKGLGVGLTLVRTVAEAHGGTVRAESPGPGRGSTFTLSLPVLEEDEGRPAAGDEGPTAAGDDDAPTAGELMPRRILLVEDREETAETMRLLIGLEGHQVRSVGTGEEAVDAVRDFRPDMVFSDLGLPGDMNGYDVARALRSTPDLPPVHLVALTGYGQESDQDRAFDAGFDGFLTKPVDPDELFELIRAFSRAELGS